MSNKKKILVIQKVHDKGMELINNHPDFDVEVTDDVSVENLKSKIKLRARDMILLLQRIEHLRNSLGLK